MRWEASTARPRLGTYPLMPRSSPARARGSLDGVTGRGRRGPHRSPTPATGFAIESETWYAKYRDGEGIVVEVPTGCRDETAARQVLADLERQAERVRAGLITPAESRTAEHLATPIGEHFDAYLDALAAAGSVPHHRQNTRDLLEPACRRLRLPPARRLEAGSLGAMACQPRPSGAGRHDRATVTGPRSSRSATGAPIPASAGLTTNPFKGIAKADEKADRRRQRRAMTEGELTRLLDVARRRPLLEALTVRRGKRKGQAVANVRPEIREQLDALGRERALIYKTLVLTGLRKDELATLTVGQLQLDGPTAYAELDAADEKNREGNAVPIRADLADDLRAWLADTLAARQDEADSRSFAPIPSRLPADTLLFTVPDGLGADSRP